MRKKTVIVVSLSTLAVLWWACLHLVLILGPEAFRRGIASTERVIFVTSSNLESEPGIRILDANNPTFEVLKMEPNRVDVKWKNTRIELEGTRFRLRKLENSLVYVMGRLNGRQYPMLIDTGCPRHLVVNDMIVKDNKLAVFPFEFPQWTLAGFCRVDKIEIGDMTVTKPPCLYTLNHYEKRVLGRTKWKQRQILLGLELLQSFRYFLVDDVSSEVEFGMRESFQAERPETWQQYPMSVEKTERNIKKIIIHVSIAGQETRASLDTGTNRSLALSRKVWSTLSTKVHVLSESQGRAQFFHGWNDITMIRVEELSIGDKCMTDAPVVVFDDSVFGENCVLIGMEYFKDTVVVIDFERSLLWVRKPEPL